MTVIQKALDGTRMYPFPKILDSYKSLIYVPLDLEVPIVDEEKFLIWFNNAYDADFDTEGAEVNGIPLNSKAITQLDPAKNSKEVYPWKIVYLHRAKGVTRNMDPFNQEFPELGKFIDDMPFDKSGSISILKQNAGVDVGIHSDFDIWFGIRFYLVNKSNARIFFQKANNPTTLRLTNWTEAGEKLTWDNFVSDEKIYARYPKPVHAFHITSTHAVHGVEAVPEDQDCSRITFFLTGKLNPEKYKELLDKSLEKYSDYAIWH
jgi:hypothetical protein